MDFQELEALRRFLAEIKLRQATSLSYYHDSNSNGFYHRYELADHKPGDLSKSSTATCVLSLVATDQWKEDPWAERSADLAKALLDIEWKSAGLKKNNAFTTAFILEAVTALEQVSASFTSEPHYVELISKAESILLRSFRNGAIKIEDYPPSAYLTQLVVRVLKKRSKISEKIASNVQNWAWIEIDHQLALLVASSPLADVYQLAYAIILVATLGNPGEATPDRSLILQAALDQLFQRQMQDGSWPRSRPLFHYPGVGSAHCYEYEMLVQLLKEPQLEDKLLRYLPNLAKAAYSLREKAFKLENDGMGWSSGHHPQLKGPESWSTASVFHFAHMLDRLVAEAIRCSIFEYLNSPYTPPKSPKAAAREFARGFLDCNVKINGVQQSLRTSIFERFVSPVAKGAGRIQSGGALSIDTAVSAIFFGPPGTSKTELTKYIADYLGWPRLTVDPSHLVRNGLDKVQAEADRLFSMLAVAERIVVLLDEFDEMFRERSEASEILSRFLTTALLPKIAAINKNRRLVFIVATNHIEHFDLAISRHGRFDIIIQIMPPTTAEKLERWKSVRSRLNDLGINTNDDSIKNMLEALTFDEFRVLAPDIEKAPAKEDATQLLIQAHKACTLETPADPKDADKTWAVICREQEGKIRTI